MATQQRSPAFSGLRMGGMSILPFPIPMLVHAPAPSSRVAPNMPRLEAEVIREKVQDGLTGETREMQYTQCKIVGNGSFGVVFQTKLSPSGEDAAIKRVLQDKRFKVSPPRFAMLRARSLLMPRQTESRAADHAHRPSPQHCRTQGLLLLQRRACTP